MRARTRARDLFQFYLHILFSILQKDILEDALARRLFKTSPSKYRTFALKHRIFSQKYRTFPRKHRTFAQKQGSFFRHVYFLFFFGGGVPHSSDSLI